MAEQESSSSPADNDQPEAFMAGTLVKEDDDEVSIERIHQL
jgi:hypothetical protein